MVTCWSCGLNYLMAINETCPNCGRQQQTPLFNKYLEKDTIRNERKRIPNYVLIQNPKEEKKHGKGKSENRR